MNSNINNKTCGKNLLRSSTLPIVMFALALSTRDACSQTIVNGSFENGNLPAPAINVFAPNSTTITGWLVGGSSVDYISSSAWQAGQGSRSIDLSGISAGSLSQSISSLLLGQTYRVSFLLSGNSDVTSFPGQNNDPIKSLVLSVGATSQQFSFDITGFSQMNMGWTPRQMDFVASSSTMTLTVTSLENNAYGPAVDNFAIAVVPEPSSIALILLGAAGFLGNRIRKNA